MVSWAKSALIAPSFTLSLASSLMLSCAAGKALQITSQQKLKTLNIFSYVSFQCFRSCTGSLKSHTNVNSWHWSSQRRWQEEPDRGDTTLTAIIWLTHSIKLFLEKPMNWSEIPCLKNATSNIFKHHLRSCKIILFQCILTNTIDLISDDDWGRLFWTLLSQIRVLHPDLQIAQITIIERAKRWAGHTVGQIPLHCACLHMWVIAST